jgi:hypothetical protein
MAERLRAKFSVIGKAWCRTMHKRTMWPIHGEYECSTCLRRHPVMWTRDVAPILTQSRLPASKKITLVA